MRSREIENSIEPIPDPGWAAFSMVLRPDVVMGILHCFAKMDPNCVVRCEHRKDSERLYWKAGCKEEIEWIAVQSVVLLPSGKKSADLA